MRFGQKYCPERKAKREIREIYKEQKKVYQRINERNNKTYNQYFILEDLSSLVYMNSSYLSRLFKKVTGIRVPKILKT